MQDNNKSIDKCNIKDPNIKDPNIKDLYKCGLLRGKLMGKRTNYCGRTVIGPNSSPKSKSENN